MQSVVPHEFEDFVSSEVASGRFRSRQEVVAEALRQFQQREQKLDRLRAELAEGLDELDRGEGIPSDQVFAELRASIENPDRGAA